MRATAQLPPTRISNSKLLPPQLQPLLKTTKRPILGQSLKGEGRQQLPLPSSPPQMDVLPLTTKPIPTTRHGSGAGRQGHERPRIRTMGLELGRSLFS